MANKKGKILITGSSGTIGTRLFEKLLEKDYEVIGFDRKENKWQDALNKLTIKGDLTLKEDIKKIPKNVDMVIHLAANARVYDLVVEPDLALENVIATYNILEFSRLNNVKKILFSSSRETYGNRKKAVAKESDVDIHLAESPYSASKISDEAFVYAYTKCYGINHIVLRFSNVYGMYDESDRFVPLMIRKMKKNEDIVIFGKDKMLDFTYIDDCVLGIIKCVEKFNRVKNNTFNLAYGKGAKLIDVANIIKKELHSESTFSLKSNRTGEVVKYVADISKAKKMIGYKPSCNVKEGVKMSIDWYNSQI